MREYCNEGAVRRVSLIVGNKSKYQISIRNETISVRLTNINLLRSVSEDGREVASSSEEK